MFDLDGTLSDPFVGIAHSINYALEHFGHANLELPALNEAVLCSPSSKSYSTEQSKPGKVCTLFNSLLQ